MLTDELLFDELYFLEILNFSFYDLHYGKFNIMCQLGIRQTILEILLRSIEVLLVGVRARAQNLHQV
jgi:hypothetical protein